MASWEASIDNTALGIITKSSKAYELSFIPHLPTLVAMVAEFVMCNRKVNNLICYFSVILFLLATKVSGTKY